MMAALNRAEVARIRQINAKLRMQNRLLLQTMKRLQENPYAECREVLTAIAQYCQENYERAPPAHWKPVDIDCWCKDELDEEEKAAAERNKSANNAFVSGLKRDILHGDTFGAKDDCKQCGGYTPGGGNKQRSAKGLKDCVYPECPDGLVPCADSSPKTMPSPATREAPAASPDAPAPAPAPAPKKVILKTKKVREGAALGGDCTTEEGLNEEGEFRPSVRILGEMAFQLERRILDYVFGVDGPQRRRFYGYTVGNICFMMEKESTTAAGGRDVISRTEMTGRLRKMLCALEKYGYNIKLHADFAQKLINKYGLLPMPPNDETIEMFGLNDPCGLSSLISRLCTSQSEVHNMNILLNCLNFLSKCDGRPIMVW